MMTSRKNLSVKGLQSMLAKEKKHDMEALLEYEISCATNPERYRTYDQWELLRLYGRETDNEGATKAVHLESHLGNEFKYICIKRHQEYGYLPECRNGYATGNQLIDEINCWERYHDKEESDLLCPILKYFTSKSDKVTSTSEKMQYNVLIIAQKAVYVSNAERCCNKAYEFNGYTGETPSERLAKMKKLSRENNWRDALYNGGNSGVIYDYNQKCYKAVFIDYAL